VTSAEATEERERRTSYLDFIALAAERSLRFAPLAERGRRARDVFTFFHYPQVLGIIFFAVGAKETLAAPLEPLPTSGRAALVLGGSLPLLATVLGRYRVTRHVAWERVAGIAASGLVGLVFRDLDAVWLLFAIVAILAATIGAEMIRLREARRQIRSDGPPR
jgi:low temperature requirement protein LtrA